MFHGSLPFIQQELTGQRHSRGWEYSTACNRRERPSCLELMSLTVPHPPGSSFHNFFVTSQIPGVGTSKSALEVKGYGAKGSLGDPCLVLLRFAFVIFAHLPKKKQKYQKEAWSHVFSLWFVERGRRAYLSGITKFIVLQKGSMGYCYLKQASKSSHELSPTLKINSRCEYQGHCSCFRTYGGISKCSWK